MSTQTKAKASELKKKIEIEQKQFDRFTEEAASYLELSKTVAVESTAKLYRRKYATAQHHADAAKKHLEKLQQELKAKKLEATGFQRMK